MALGGDGPDVAAGAQVEIRDRMLLDAVGLEADPTELATEQSETPAVVPLLVILVAW